MLWSINWLHKLTKIQLWFLIETPIVILNCDTSIWHNKYDTQLWHPNCDNPIAKCKLYPLKTLDFDKSTVTIQFYINYEINLMWTLFLIVQVLNLGTCALCIIMFNIKLFWIDHSLQIYQKRISKTFKINFDVWIVNKILKLLILFLVHCKITIFVHCMKLCIQQKIL